MRKVAVFLAVCFLVGAATMAQVASPGPQLPPQPPPTQGVKNAFEFRLECHKVFWPDSTDANGQVIKQSDMAAGGGIGFWISDHAMIELAAYHDTLWLESFAPQLPKSAHTLWGFDLNVHYTLKTFSPSTLPEIPGDWTNWLNQHAKNVTVHTVGGIGTITLAGQPMTATYWLGLETRWWFTNDFYGAITADVRYATYMGVSRTFPETRVYLGYRVKFWGK